MQARAGPVNGLYVIGVDPRRASMAQRGQHRARLDLEIVLNAVARNSLSRMRLNAELGFHVRPNRAAQLGADELHSVADAQNRQPARLRGRKAPAVGTVALGRYRRKIVGQGADQAALNARAAGDQQTVDAL